MNAGCVLCDGDGGTVLWRDDRLRIVMPGEVDHPGMLRVVWNAHVKEMTDLRREDRAACLDAVCTCESALRDVLQPDKVNLASFGNVVPHLHWHVIPRYHDDPHFPNPIWGSRRRDTPRAVAAGFAADVAARLQALFQLDRDRAGDVR